MKTDEMRLLTVAEIRRRMTETNTVIIPYALSEQHGHHLPLDTDIRNAEYAARGLAERLGCLIAPTLNYTFSGGMLPGTINVKPNTFSNMIGEIIESLSRQGFRNFIILPGHGGSESMFHLKESLRILKWLNPSLRDDLILMLPLWDFSPTWTALFEQRDYHAAQAETSLMLHWCPEVVRTDIAMDEPEVAERLRSNPDSYQQLESFTALKQEIIQTSQREDVKVGVMGYPEKASAELGAKIESEFLENASRAVAEAIRQADAARRSGERIVHDGATELKILSL
jgi:creatinine amidohydrolase